MPYRVNQAQVEGKQEHAQLVLLALPEVPLAEQQADVRLVAVGERRLAGRQLAAAGLLQQLGHEM